MPHQISHSQTRLAVGDGPPIVIDVESAMDEVYTALSNERRREVLCILLRESVPMELETLVDEVAKQEAPATAERAGDDHRKRIRLTLYHMHLPKLADLDLIEFDTDALRVETIADSVSSLTA